MKISTLAITFASGIAGTAAESNCGQIPCLNFDPVDQYVDVSSATGHQFIAPGATDIRGPCPGLNAAANHGYLPRNGITTLQQSIVGLGQAFNFGTDLATALGIVAVIQAGNVIEETWSIGGPYYPSSIAGLLGGNPRGISYSHNRYEADASFARSDAYTNFGDAHSLNMAKFQHFYNLAYNDTYNISATRDHGAWNRAQSVSNNPYFFSPPFAGFVASVAHPFVVNMFSNHSAEQPNGYLDRATLKSFFGVSGPDSALVWNKGQERIPNNWYRRPSSNPYTLASGVLDTLANLRAYPDSFRVGGNTGTVNSFAGVDLGNLTGGTYNLANLVEGNNLVCFAIQAMQLSMPDAISGIVGDLATVLAWATKLLTPILTKLSCPELAGYDTSLFEKFPGSGYNPPTGKAEPFK
ncbi:hypothetical protein CJF32_00001736 [Rutstroemia sp. NJR-2017a WRK4]|nr:hypothetical protein CJF32_00001736 [Rutstroemia sp. NJR-2017a WRK4]